MLTLQTRLAGRQAVPFEEHLRARGDAPPQEPAGRPRGSDPPNFNVSQPRRFGTRALTRPASGIDVFPTSARCISGNEIYRRRRES